MGRIKQLLPYGDGSLLELALEHALASQVDAVYCVLGAHAKQIQKKINNSGVTFITNPNWEKGLSSSIVAGVSYLESAKKIPESVLVMLADQPYVDNQYLEALIACHNKNPEHIVASSYRGVKGVPALFPKQYYQELLKLEGDKGAKAFLNNNTVDTLVITSKKQQTLMDVDTPEDYNNLLEG